ncbi:hypothetical protein ACFE04_013861 [Oxalis oulophora]
MGNALKAIQRIPESTTHAAYFKKVTDWPFTNWLATCHVMVFFNIKRFQQVPGTPTANTCEEVDPGVTMMGQASDMVRPLNQNAFDYACEKSEVDIVSIDFSSKLPFRLKMPMVKAAIEKMNISLPEIGGMQLRKCISSDQDAAELSMKNVKGIETEIEGMQLKKGISIDQDAELSMNNVDSDSLTQDMELDGVINDITVTEKNSTPHITSTVKELKNTTNSVEHPSSKLDNTGGLATLSADIIDSNSLKEESKIMGKSDVILVEQNEMLIDVEVEADQTDLGEADRDVVSNGVITYGNASGGEKSEEASNDRDAVEVKDCPSIANREPLSEVSMEETRDGESNCDADLPTLVKCVSECIGLNFYDIGKIVV